MSDDIFEHRPVDSRTARRTGTRSRRDARFLSPRGRSDCFEISSFTSSSSSSRRGGRHRRGALALRLRVASLSRSDARRASKSRRGIVADRPARRGRVGGAVDGAAGGGGVGTRGGRGAGGFPRGASPSASSPSRARVFAILAARGVVRRCRRLARGARPKRPTTRRPIASSSLFSPLPANEHFAHLPRRLTLPARRTLPAHSPGCPHRVLRPPEPRYPPRASRASTRSPPSRSSSVGSQPRFPPSPPRRPPGWTSTAAAHGVRVAAFVLGAVFGAVAAPRMVRRVDARRRLARAAFPTRIAAPLAPVAAPSACAYVYASLREPSSTRARSEDTCTDTRGRRRVVKKAREDVVPPAVKQRSRALALGGMDSGSMDPTRRLNDTASLRASRASPPPLASRPPHGPLRNRSMAALTFPMVACSARMFCASSKKPLSLSCASCDA